jgi:hypothetical protein
LQIGRLGHPRNNEQKTSFGSEGWFKLILLKRLEWVRAETIRQTKLAFDDLVNQFNAAQNSPGVEEALETKHWSHAAFYPPVILFGFWCKW